ncbi:MAG: aminotransferase class III-fold pyridoxal phosphate-dependent enzyme, partial [Cloacibacillus evryensis]
MKRKVVACRGAGALYLQRLSCRRRVKSLANAMEDIRWLFRHGLYGGRGIALTHGEGAWVWGSDGRRYIDFFNGHGAALFGHANPVLTEALAEAARGVWSCGAGYESPAREELGAILGGELGDGRVFSATAAPRRSRGRSSSRR